MVAGFHPVDDDRIGRIFRPRHRRGKGVASDLPAVLEGDLRARGVAEACLRNADGGTRAGRIYRRNDWTDPGPHLVGATRPDGTVRRAETGLFIKRLGP